MLNTIIAEVLIILCIFGIITVITFVVTLTAFLTDEWLKNQFKRKVKDE